MTELYPEQAAANLVMALGILMRRVRSASSEAAHELSWSQISVISRLEREGPATTAQLARAEGVKPQSMGATIAMLEEMGLVEKRPHPTDGRQMTIALTQNGETLRKESRSAKRAWLAAAIAKLNPEEQAALPALTSLLKRLASYDLPDSGDQTPRRLHPPHPSKTEPYL